VTTAAVVLLAAAAPVAVADWVAVAVGWRRIELGSKPLVILLMLGAALALDPGNANLRWFFVAGLALSAVGDVALLAPPRWFAMGLVAFLVAHGAYIGGLVQVSGGGESVAAGLVFVGLADLFLGVPIIRGAAARRGPALAGAVALYLIVISGTVVAAGAADLTLARIGTVLLFTSDGILGWNRFVVPLRQGRLLTRIPYHLGQGLMVLAIAGGG